MNQTQPTAFLTFDTKEEKLEEVLVELGYDLKDCGKYWQCNAVYRDGDNQTALQIWKNSGVWRDFVAGTSYLPFEKLVKLSCRDDFTLQEIKHKLKNSTASTPVLKPEKMETQTFFDHEEVGTLLPQYNFYNKKNISSVVLEKYRAGFSMSGKMNGRFVFPVYDANHKIIGMSGRHLLWKPSSKFPKWKHIGRKANWIYPANLPFQNENLVEKAIEEKREIIIVEGIGDSLALAEQGVWNHMVAFGLGISPKQMSYLISLDLDKIIISTNNDANKPRNIGLEAAIKAFVKLTGYFDISKIEIKLPLLKDFGEMLEKGVDLDRWINKKINKSKQIERIIQHLRTIKADHKQTQLLKNHLEQLTCETDIIS